MPYNNAKTTRLYRCESCSMYHLEKDDAHIIWQLYKGYTVKQLAEALIEQKETLEALMQWMKENNINVPFVRFMHGQIVNLLR